MAQNVLNQRELQNVYVLYGNSIFENFVKRFAQHVSIYNWTRGEARDRMQSRIFGVQES